MTATDPTIPNATPNPGRRWYDRLGWIKTTATVIETVLALAATMFLGVLIFSQFDATSPIRFVSSETHVVTNSEGSTFWLTRETCLDRDLPAIALGRLVSSSPEGISIPLPPKTLSTFKGCRKLTILVQIPEDAPPGEYEYLVTIRFQMNPFKTLDVEAPAVRVTVMR